MISSHILPTTFQKNLSQQNFLKTQQNWDINLGQSVTALPSFFHAQYVQPYSLLPKRRRSPHIHLPHNTYNLILCDPTGVDLLTYAPPPHSSLSPSLQNAANQDQNAGPSVTTLPSLFHSQYIQPDSLGPNRRRSPHILLTSPLPLLPTTRNPCNIILCVPTGVDLVTYTTHWQYIQPYSCFPTGVDLPTYASHSQKIPPYSLRPNRRWSPHTRLSTTFHKISLPKTSSKRSKKGS